MTSHKSIGQVLGDWDPAKEGAELFRIVSDLYPICRRITGEGFRESLRYLGSYAPMSCEEVPTGTQVFDWTIPKEWNVRDAWIKDAKGKKVVDFHKCNLHVLNYSAPIHRKAGLQELKEHLHTIPNATDWIPYRTSYYKETWGFCISHRQLERLEDEEYEVCIDSTLGPGHLTYGELGLRGATEEEILISCHSCHPSLCNDNLSGMAVTAKLSKHLQQLGLRYSYRFVWIPGTIGAITWLAKNETMLPRIKHGLVVSCVGDTGAFTYKRSRRGNAEIDRAVEHCLRHSGRAYQITDFTPYGYDERQYGSPGINLPVGCFMRTPHGKYPQYHTSADDLTFVKPEALADSLFQLLSVIALLEQNERYLNLNLKCEPQLGRRGLYRQMGGTSSKQTEEAMLWTLNFSDGQHSLLDIAERSGIPFPALRSAADSLLTAELLRKI